MVDWRILCTHVSQQDCSARRKWGEQRQRPERHAPCALKNRKNECEETAVTTTSDTQRTSHFVEVNGVTLHALDWGGDGPPVIMVHGTGRTGRSWNAIARRLRDTYRVIALDLRGH